MSWFGKKKEEKVEVDSKELTMNTKSLINIPIGNKSTK